MKPAVCMSALPWPTRQALCRTAAWPAWNCGKGIRIRPAFSLHLMARLYLDGDEDPELAETLARQSVALRPDRKAAWLELARALEAQGRHRDAREARVRAAEL